MAPTYRYDHMHLRSRDVQKTAEYYHRVFDAEIVESIQSDWRPRTDLDLNGLTIFIAPVAANAAIPSAPSEPYIGLDHFGLRVDNMDEAVAELKRRGARFKLEPRTIRPGVRIAFIEAPEPSTARCRAATWSRRSWLYCASARSRRSADLVVTVVVMVATFVATAPRLERRRERGRFPRRRPGGPGSG